MKAQSVVREDLLNKLNQTVLDATVYLGSADENLYDGHQSAHAVLAQLVFWHERYVEIVQALVEGREPSLPSGTFAQINQRARRDHAGSGMVMLAHKLSIAQRKLLDLLRKLPDWSVDFPIRRGEAPVSILERLVEIELHIHRHITRLKMAEGQPITAAAVP